MSAEKARKTYQFKIKPAPYQLEALKRAVKRGRYGIFFEQRVGKTKVAIDFCGIKHSWEGVNKVLIFTPLSVRLEWDYQIREHLPDGIDYDIHLYPTAKVYKYREKRKALLKATKNPDKLTFIIANYDVLDSDEADKLIRWSPDAVIFDEAHLLRGHSSRRSRCCYRIARTCDNVLGLTGTPIPKHPKDLFGLFRAIDPQVYGHRWQDFKAEYLVFGGYMDTEVIAVVNKEKLTQLMHSTSMRVLRKDVMHEPIPDNILIPVELEEAAKRAYLQLKTVYLAELDGGKVITADMAGVRVGRLQQLCGGFLKDDDGKVHQVSKAKLDALKDLITTHCVEGGEKMVVVAKYREEIAAIGNMLSSMKIQPLVIAGGVDETTRGRAKTLFQTDPKYPVIVIQIETGGMGISLDAAHIITYYSMNYVLGDYQQSRDRIMGRGQKADRVTRYFLAVKGSVDEKVIKTLMQDEDLASQIANRWRWLLT